MYQSFERAWVDFLDSNRFRAIAGQGVAAGLFRSRAYRRLLMAKNYLSSSRACARQPAAFREVETFCLFIGHNKSGTSLIGALLDAHPNVILADEVRAMEYVAAGFSRDQLFHILRTVSRREFMKGRVTARRLTPYSYLVPGQWQGRHDSLRVVGDGASGWTTRAFAAQPDLLGRLDKLMAPAKVRLIQVIRNPYDPISVMMVRGKRSFENAIERYFVDCGTLLSLRSQLGSNDLLAVRYEDFVRQAELKLAQLCRYLGVQPSEDYLKACGSILHRSPRRDREMVEWSRKWIDVVRRGIERFDFLHGYSFEE